jgi:hypothetical protein
LKIVTKKYKYNCVLVKDNLKKVLWGETIKRVALFYILAISVVALAAPALADNPVFGKDSVDILGDGIFETNGGAFRFPFDADTNIDSIVVGNDIARSFGWSIPPLGGRAVATNNLEIKKNQDSGDCSPCLDCGDNCVKYNTDNVRVGDRSASAFGFATATNNMKIVLNQQ